MQVQRGTGFRVARLLAAFGAHHPGVQVVARQRGSVVQAADVREGRLDLALVGLPEDRLSGLRVDALTREDVMLVVPRGHRLADHASVALADLDGERFVDVPPEWGTRAVTDAAFTAAGLTRDVAFDLNDTGSVVDFVRHGLAIALTPASFVGPADGDEHLDAVVLVPLRGRPLKFVTSLVSPADRPMSAASRALRETALRLAGGAG
jgi:DNA-binding transcriptional LysR family regulator